MHQPRLVLTIIVWSQFCCTSLWFAGNGVMNELVAHFSLPGTALGHLTSAVQFGFIAGTLTFAILTIADRFSPSKVFLLSALLGALCNAGAVLDGQGLWSLIALRVLTGFFLAGIYPVGMKIAADHFEKGLGLSLGFLVGALVVGTAFPHLLRDLTLAFSWRSVLLVTSTLAILGGLLMYSLVPDGPYRKAGRQIDLTACFTIFRNSAFRSPAFGYFGHMWELYAFWAFTPLMLLTYQQLHPEVVINIPIWSFLIIGIGGPACVLSGYLSQKVGTRRTAFASLLLSCLCCLLSPLAFALDHTFLFLTFMLFWGIVVIADSPLFSTMVAHMAPPHVKGTALTIVNSIGFAITIISIQLLTWLREISDTSVLYPLLAIGPVFGLIALGKKGRLQHRD